MFIFCYTESETGHLYDCVEDFIFFIFLGQVEYHGLKKRHDEMEKQRASVTDGSFFFLLF